VSGGHFFSPWESPLICVHTLQGCGHKSKAKRTSFEKSNATVRWTVARRGPGDTLIFFRLSKRKCKRVPSGVPKKNNPNLISVGEEFGLFLIKETAPNLKERTDEKTVILFCLVFYKRSAPGFRRFLHRYIPE